MTPFQEAFERFLERDETGDHFVRARWKAPIPYLDELEAVEGNLLRRHVEAAARERVDKGIVFALVWGYPMGYTSKESVNKESNLQTAISRDLQEFTDLVEQLKNYPTKASKAIKSLNKVAGVATASTSKAAFFSQIDTREGRCLIFDRQVVRAILQYPYDELDGLRDKLAKARPPAPASDEVVDRIVNSPVAYEHYLAGMVEITNALGRATYIEDVERYLFTLGRER